MVKKAVFIAAFIGCVVGYCLPHTITLPDIKVGQDYGVVTYLEDNKNAGTGVFIYDGGHCAVSNKLAIDMPENHADLRHGKNYLALFDRNGQAVAWYRLK